LDAAAEPGSVLASRFNSDAKDKSLVVRSSNLALIERESQGYMSAVLERSERLRDADGGK
jgi:hypothetical protein